MAINDWWAGRPAEHFWMEITDREDLGGELKAPQTNAAGGEEWSYALVTYAQAGDIVLHWHKSIAGEPALIGWSEVTGPLAADSMDWLAHGTRGRARGRMEHVPSWVNPLGGLHQFTSPVTRTALEAVRTEVFAVIDDLKADHPGPIYPPFYLYGGRQLRAMQSYLTKFPAALVSIIESLAGESIGEPSPRPSPADPMKKRAKARRTPGRLQDSVLRKLIEDYAVDRAVAHYRARGATSIDPLGKPYDLKVRIGREERHVEVKGTTVDGAVSVVLTVGEVKHARSWTPTDLFVVDGISYAVEGDSYTLSGGLDRLWSDWIPDDEALHPTQFSYDLPQPGSRNDDD